MIICCAAEERHTAETVSTLRFGERAKKIKNNAHVNEELGIPELKQMLQVARAEIVNLKSQLAPYMSGGAGRVEGAQASPHPALAVSSLNTCEPLSENYSVLNDDVKRDSLGEKDLELGIDYLVGDEEGANVDKGGDGEHAARIAELEEALEMERRMYVRKLLGIAA